MAGILFHFIAKLPWNISPALLLGVKLKMGENLTQGKQQISSNPREFGIILPQQVPVGRFSRQQQHIQCPAGATSGQGHTQCGASQCFILLFLSKFRFSPPSLIPDTFVPGTHPYLQFFTVPKDLG